MLLMVKLTGPLIARFGIKSVMVIGLIVLSGALSMLSTIPADGSYLVSVLPATLIAALGMSLAYIPVTMTGMGGAAPEDTGLASGLINTTYQVGSALGLAIMVSVAAAQSSGGNGGMNALLASYSSAFAGAALIALAASVFALLFVRGNAKPTDVPVA